MLDQFRGGLSYVRHEGPLFGLTIVGFVTTFLAMPLLTLLPVFVQKVFHLGVAEYGRMMAFQGAGAVVGALIVAWVGRFTGMGAVALMVQIGLGAVIAAFALSSNPTLSYALLFVAGTAQLVVFSLANSLVQLARAERDARTGDEHLHGGVPQRHAARQPRGRRAREPLLRADGARRRRRPADGVRGGGARHVQEDQDDLNGSRL